MPLRNLFTHSVTAALTGEQKTRRSTQAGAGTNKYLQDFVKCKTKKCHARTVNTPESVMSAEPPLLHCTQTIHHDMTDSDMVAEMVPEQPSGGTPASSHSGNPGGVSADMTDSDMVAEMVPEHPTGGTPTSSHSGNPGGGSADMTDSVQ